SVVNHCTQVPDDGMFFSITSPVLGSITEILSTVCCATHRLWYLSNAIPYGRLYALVSSCILLNVPSNGSKTDTACPACSAMYSFPVWVSNVMAVGSSKV